MSPHIHDFSIPSIYMYDTELTSYSLALFHTRLWLVEVQAGFLDYYKVCWSFLY